MCTVIRRCRVRTSIAPGRAFRAVSAALTAGVLLSTPVRAQDSIITYKSLSPELALDLARASLAERFVAENHLIYCAGSALSRIH